MFVAQLIYEVNISVENAFAAAYQSAELIILTFVTWMFFLSPWTVDG